MRVGRSVRPPAPGTTPGAPAGPGCGCAWCSAVPPGAARVARAYTEVDVYVRSGSENRDRDRLYSCTK